MKMKEPKKERGASFPVELKLIIYCVLFGDCSENEIIADEKPAIIQRFCFIIDIAQYKAIAQYLRNPNSDRNYSFSLFIRYRFPTDRDILSRMPIPIIRNAGELPP